MSSVAIGVLAHVDAGKTTCIESLLYKSGALRKQGRVDHQDTFLDYDEQERSRGITIYSKQAGLEWKDTHIDVIDTPGHADFSAEMERALSVLDLAVVVVSGLDGVQSHTKTIWKCLEHYHIPALIFVNKMDISHKTRDELLQDIRLSLSENIVDLNAEDRMEQFAALDDELLETYTETFHLEAEQLRSVVSARKAFPVLFGSALKNEGIEELLDALITWAPRREWPLSFGARVFKITTEENGAQLCHTRITGGTLKNKDRIDEQKVDQLRIYSGKGFKSVNEVHAGEICTIKGLSGIHPGDGLGAEEDLGNAVLESCLLYEMILPDGVDAVEMMGWCRSLMMEDPTLQIEYDEQAKAILVHLMGDIQMEVLQNRVFALCGHHVSFGPGKIVFKETIAQPVMGYGHFEPLRHYAEVHLLLEPLKRGSGMVYTSKVSRDELSLNWQRLILSHLAEREHKGTLTGSSLTDMRVTLIAGKAHPKHTSGGDFRQATFRALRQGQKKAETVLLEPYYRFTLSLPAESLSRALFDLETRKATVEVHESGDEMVIRGRGPVRTLLNYQMEAAAYSHGSARFQCESDGYDICLDSEQIVNEIGYDSEMDRWHPTGSVFCMHGCSETIDWQDVEEHLHLPIETERSSSWTMNSSHVSEQEMKRVFAQAGGSNRNEKKRVRSAPKKKTSLDMNKKAEISPMAALPTCLIVDGYNMIYSWPELKDLSRTSLQTARERLIDLVVNYAGYKGWSLILVFDGWKRNDNQGSSRRFGTSTIVYTRTGQSADAWIEKKVHELKGKFKCITATSDGLIQNSALGSGSSRMSASELEKRVHTVNAQALSHLKP